MIVAVDSTLVKLLLLTDNAVDDLPATIYLKYAPILDSVVAANADANQQPSHSLVSSKVPKGELHLADENKLHPNCINHSLDTLRLPAFVLMVHNQKNRSLFLGDSLLSFSVVLMHQNQSTLICHHNDGEYSLV